MPASPAPLVAAGSWPGWLAALQITADLLVWVAYVIVPIVLLVRGRRRTLPLRRVFDLLALFVTCCGVAHALQVISFGAGPGATGTALALATAAVVWGAALIVLRFLPRAAAVVEQEVRGEELDRLRLLEAAVTASGDGVMIAEATPAQESGPRIVYANPAFESIMGYTAEEAFGLTPSVFCVPGSDDSPGGESTTGEVRTDPEAEAAFEALRSIRAALGGNQAVRLELPTRRKDGARVWAEWQLVPVAATDGRPMHWVGVIRDVTERRHLEDQLRQSQKMEAVGRLAGGIAHDFNNLLTVIRGNADLLREPVPGLDSPIDTTELVDDIRGAADRAAGLVRQLLTFSRRQPARLEVVDLNEVVSGLAGLLRRLLGERVAVRTDTALESVRVRIDRGQLEQVVMNLAVNARDAMPDGGTLTIGTAPVTDAGPGGALVRLSRLTLSDTGCGMTPAVKARVFEPFFTTKGPGKGTGLGLATVYGIVQHAGGRITVESTPGVGTAFRIDLPWCEANPGPSSGMLPVQGLRSASVAGRGRSVLLVEDEAAVRKLARFTLEGQSYTVSESPDGETALKMLAIIRPPDLLVTDLSMPGMDGRQLAARVRLVCPGVVFVFVSGYAPDSAKLDGVPGAVFLSKPFTPDDLLRAAARAIRRVQAAATPVI